MNDEMQQPKVNLEITDDPIVIRTILQECIDALRKSDARSRGRSLAITKMEEARFWLGEALMEGA